jgi:hypothetical protein
MKRLDNDDFDFLHSWIWDRTRAIRKDLRTQRIEQRSDITLLLTALERSARFLLLSAHQMARTEKEDYSYQQDIEQLNQTLMSLRERYADNRRVGYPSENEAEFYAYRLILDPLFTNTQLENELNRLPSDLRNNPRVQTAVQIYRALKSVIFTKAKSLNQAQANWKRFWDLVKSPTVSYLMACAAEVSFQRVRHVVLDSLWRTFRIGSTSKPQLVETWTTDRVQQVLGFDTPAQAVELCESYGFRFGRSAAGHTFLDVTAKGFVRKPLDLAPDLKPQIFSQGIVEVKRHNRAFSAIVQSMTVQEAKTHGLMIDSLQAGMEDQSSLFIPEAPAAKFNAFLQPNGNSSGTSNPTQSTNPFIRHASTSPAPDVTKPNPFLPAKTTSTQPFPGAASNAFVPAQAPSNQPFPGLTAGGVQPGLFDAAKNPVKFGTSGTAGTPFANSNKPNPFISTPTSTEPTLSVNKSDGSIPKFNFSTGATTPISQQKTASESTTTPTGSFVFPGFVPGGVKPQSSTPASSFTPAGSPTPAMSTVQNTEKQKADDDLLRRKVEAEAEIQRQRAREEQARLAREQAERQRIEAEQHRQRLQEEERSRLMQAAREQEVRAEQARIARLQARESGYDSLTTDLMFDVEEGLMMQFVENLIVNVAGDVLAAKEEERRRNLREKQETLADAMYARRILGLKRLVMASWITKVEKKKKARQAKERRKRLREKKAKMATMEDAASDMLTPTNSEAATEQPDDDITFRKPQAPASTRRAKRTEERRGTMNSYQNGKLDTIPPSAQTGQQAGTHAILTPISMGSSHTSSAAYSEAYQKSNAPIDRTATEYFTLRAQGIDPRMLRKRSFDSSSDEDQPEVEPKRPKMSPSTTKHQPVLPLNRASEYRAGLDAIEQHFRKSGGSPQSATCTTSVNGRMSLNGRSSMLIDQARQLLAKSRSAHVSPPNVQHDWGRSVPNLGHRSSISYHSVLGRSMSAAAKKERAAYWDRDSRFVAKEVYGKGPEAVRAYRNEHGLNSHTNTRPSSIDPTAMPSPTLVQQSYMPLNGYTQEQHSEGNDSSGIDVIDVDAEDENVLSTEEEYEGDEESEEEEQQPPLCSRPFNSGQHYDEHGGSFMDDGDSSMQDYEGVEHVANYVIGQHVDEVLENSDGSTEEDSEENSEECSEEESEEELDEDSDEEDARIAAAKKAAGNTEDDAIELSD